MHHWPTGSLVIRQPLFNIYLVRLLDLNNMSQLKTPELCCRQYMYEFCSFDKPSGLASTCKATLSSCLMARAPPLATSLSLIRIFYEQNLLINIDASDARHDEWSCWPSHGHPCTSLFYLLSACSAPINGAHSKLVREPKAAGARNARPSSV